MSTTTINQNISFAFDLEDHIPEVTVEKECTEYVFREIVKLVISDLQTPSFDCFHVGYFNCYNISHMYVSIRHKQKKFTLSMKNDRLLFGSQYVLLSDPLFIEKMRILIRETFILHYKSKIKKSERAVIMNAKWLTEMEAITFLENKQNESSEADK